MADLQLFDSTPVKYPTNASYEEAMLSFLVYVVRALVDAGFYVMPNMAKFISGDSGSDDGTLMAGWCTRVGNAVARSSGWGMYVEPALKNLASARPRLQASSWEDYWYSWTHDLMAAIYATGTDAWLNLCWNTAGDSAALRYSRASVAMFWDGSTSGFSWFLQGASDVMQAASFAFDLGQPVGSFSVDGNGCYTRQFQNGWAACNPTGTSRSVTVGGVAKTIPSGDGFVGVP